MDFEPLYKIIRFYEGFYPLPYLCPAGVPTIGYGSTGPDIHMGMQKVTRQWAEDRMKQDAGCFVREALLASPVLLSRPSQLCAVASFCYNLGSTRYKASTLRKKVNAQLLDEVAPEFRKWVWGGGRKLNGLVARRESEIKLFFTKEVK